MIKMKSFNDFIMENNKVNENQDYLSSAMNKVMVYNKRMMSSMCGINESYYNNNKDIYFSTNEKNAIVEMYKEFIPQTVIAMAKELNENGLKFKESMIEEIGITFDVIEEGVFGKTWKSAIDTAKSVAGKLTKSKVDDVEEYADEESEVIKKEKKPILKKIVDKYAKIIKYIKKLISESANSVKDFIHNAAKLLGEYGDTLSSSLRTLGAFDKDSGEVDAKVNIDNKLWDGLSKDNGEKSFISHVVAYISIMMGDNKEKVEKLLSEGVENVQFDFSEDALNEGVKDKLTGLVDKVANNKFMQFILCYGKNTKISWWKSILISIVGSLIISIALPIILAIAGVGAATIPSIVGAVHLIWSGRSVLKVLLNRWVNKKDGEKFFDKKTCLLLVICILPQIPPFRDWIKEAFESILKMLGIDKWIEDLEGLLNSLIKKLHGTEPEVETITEAWDDVIQQGGGNVRFMNLEQNNADIIAHAKASGADDKAMSALEKFLVCANNGTGSIKLHKIWEDFISKSGSDLNHGYFIDSHVHGVNSKLIKAMEIVQSMGEDPGATTGVIGGEYLHGTTKHFAGACPLMYNVTEDFKDKVINQFVKMGGNASDLDITEFGDKIASVVIHHDGATQAVHWLFKTLVDSFGLDFVPILDKKSFGKYKMSFGSNTTKLPYHVVSEVKIMDMSDTKEYTNDNVAYSKMIGAINDINNTHTAFINNLEKRKEETEDADEKKIIDKKIKEQQSFLKENSKIDKRKVVVIYVDWNDKKTGKTEKVPGVLIDLMSMMCVDICPKRKPRRNPYFVKGLLSKLSFKPVEKNDNETKQFLREKWGITAGNSVRRIYDKGIGSCIIEYRDKKFSPVGDYKDERELPYLANFTTEEFCEILNDDSEENKVAYSYMSGKYGVASTYSLNKNGKLSLKNDKNTIENRRYVSADTPIPNDKEVTVKTKDGEKVRKKYSEMAKYKADKYNMRRATPEEIEEGVPTMDYVEARIIPMINDKKTKLHKELYKDDDIRKLFFKDGDDEEVDAGLILSIKDYLYRAESSFSEKDEHNACEKMNSYRKNNDQDELGKDSYDTIKKAVELIWELKGKHSNSKKLNKEKNQQTNERRFLRFDDFIKLYE